MQPHLSSAEPGGSVRLPSDQAIVVATDGRSKTHATSIRGLAVRALHAELVTYPKPGLVSLVDAGSHRDMDAHHFVYSAFSLRRYFERAATVGLASADFAVLRTLGLEAEARMLRATDGVNTHRGAIFVLGLLAAAAGLRVRMSIDASLGELVRRAWGPALAAHRREPASHGSRAAATHGAGGALAEAQAGFPSVFAIALPAYRAVLATGGASNQARVQARVAPLS